MTRTVEESLTIPVQNVTQMPMMIHMPETHMVTLTHHQEGFLLVIHMMIHTTAEILMLGIRMPTHTLVTHMSAIHIPVIHTAEIHTEGHLQITMPGSETRELYHLVKYIYMKFYTFSLIGRLHDFKTFQS